MTQTDRLHALDAVRAGALLLGLVLHAAAAFLQDFPVLIWTDTPAPGAAILYFVIHMFRMSAFFLIAGFFARMMLQRRGVKAFVTDRAKRIGIPLLAFPLVLITIGIGVLIGGLPHGADYLLALQQQAAPADSPVVPQAVVVGPDFAHLWFLYYLLLFYAIALALRAAIRKLDPRECLAGLSDRLVHMTMRGPWAPFVVAAPVVAYLWQYDTWNEWLGLPAPAGVLPDVFALVGYGVAFGFGWLLQRQPPCLLGVERNWRRYLLAAGLLTVLCLKIVGVTPRWSGPALAGDERLLYAAAYCLGAWCWIFGLTGAAIRFLSTPNERVRYVADASYWIYLMHMMTVVLFITLLRPFALHWSIKLVLTVAGSLPILLVTYHYWVRFTWLGALLNGRRQPRPNQSPPADPALAQT